MGRMDRCVESILPSVNSRVMVLIAAVNNSNPLLVGTPPRKSVNTHRADAITLRTVQHINIR